MRQSKAGHKAEALGLFEDAYLGYPDSRILLNIALTQRELGRLVDAAETYQRFLDDPARPADRVAQADAALAELAPQLGHLQLEVASTTDAAVEVAIDDGAWRPLPAGRLVHVGPGAHRVRARGGGAQVTAEVTVDAAAGAVVAVALRLIDEVVPEVAPPPPPALPVEAPAVPDPATPARPPGRFGAMVAIAIDPASSGAAAVIAATFAAHPRVQVNVGGMVGGNNAAFVTATAALLPGRLRPTATVGGVLAFYSWSGADHMSVGTIERTLVGGHAALGVEWWPGPRVGVLAEAAVEYYPSGEPDIHPLVFTPTVGVRGRL